MNVNTQPVSLHQPDLQQRSTEQAQPEGAGNPLDQAGRAVAHDSNVPVAHPARSNAAMEAQIREQFLGRAAFRLNTAIRRGDTAELGDILDLRGIDPNTPANGITPLIMAVRMNDVPAMKALLARPGLDVNAANMQGNTALHLAAQAGQLEQMRALLGTAGINARQQNMHGFTPLCIAAQHNHDRAVKLLLLHQMFMEIDPADSAEERRTAYTQAAKWNAFKATTVMLRDTPGFVDVRRPDGHTVLTAAIKEGRHDVVRALLMRHPDLNVNIAGEGLATALNVACRKGSLDIVLMLLRHPGLDPNVPLDKHGTTVLHQAVSYRNVFIVQALLSAGPAIDVNAEAKFIGTPLHAAVMCGDMDALRVLAARVDNINQSTEKGWTALHFAAFAGKVEAARFLLQQPDIQADTLNGTGKYPSDIARDFGHMGIARLLAEAELMSSARKTLDWVRDS